MNEQMYIDLLEKELVPAMGCTEPIAIAFACAKDVYKRQALWGSAAPFIKTGYALFDIASNDTASILVFAGLRFTLAGVLVIVAGSKIQNKILLPVKKSIKAIFVLSIFQTMGQYFFYYVGLAHTSGVNGAIITGTGAFISLLVAALVFKLSLIHISL